MAEPERTTDQPDRRPAGDTGRLAGRIAIITGAGSGFGRTTAQRFAEEGARLVLGDIDAPSVARTVELVTASGGTAVAVVGDVSVAAGADALAAEAIARFGGIDVLVNNAGIATGDAGRSWDAPEASWDRVVQVNLKSVYLCCRAALPTMIAAGHGAVVNVASIAATRAVGGASYAAAKGGLLSYTRFVATEIAPHGVRINCVSPGYMRTPMSTGERQGLTADEQEARMAQFARRVPLRRSGSTTDIADAIVYLASDEASYVTGQELVVDGGYLVS